MSSTRIIIAIAALLLAIAAHSFSAHAAQKEFVVVIDAGHGGHDHGAQGNITNEKSINLGVALKLGKKLKKEKGVKVVFTRDDDTFVTLQGRADIANKVNGDLFISIHTNSVDKKSKNRLTVAGASVYTLGFKKSQDNLAVAMRENSVMKLESDYSTVYEGFDPTSDESYIIFEMSQNKHMEHSIMAAMEVQQELVSTARRKDHGVRQANFWVLFKTGMPAMLVELDFICNPTVEKFLDSKSGQEDLAQAIYNGVMAYKQVADKEKAVIAGEKVTALERHRFTPDQAEEASRAEEKPVQEPVKPAKSRSEAAETSTPAASNGVVYKIQFLTHSNLLPESSKLFKGLDSVNHYIENNTYKYTYGEYQSQKGASVDLNYVRQKFPDAFIIKTVNGQRVK